MNEFWIYFSVWKTDENFHSRVKEMKSENENFQAT